MDVKKVAMILAITVLLPLFVGLFTDAVYQQPKYENYCNSSFNAIATVANQNLIILTMVVKYTLHVIIVANILMMQHRNITGTYSLYYCLWV